MLSTIQPDFFSGPYLKLDFFYLPGFAAAPGAVKVVLSVRVAGVAVDFMTAGSGLGAWLMYQI